MVARPGHRPVVSSRPNGGDQGVVVDQCRTLKPAVWERIIDLTSEVYYIPEKKKGIHNESRGLLI